MSKTLFPEGLSLQSLEIDIVTERSVLENIYHKQRESYNRRFSFPLKRAIDRLKHILYFPKPNFLQTRSVDGR